MTLKKSNKNAQAIFEYFILTTVVVTVVLLFSKSGFFSRQKEGDPKGVKEICVEAYNNAVAKIEGIEEGDKIN